MLENLRDDVIESSLFLKAKKMLRWLRPFSFVNVIFYIFCLFSFIFFVFFLVRILISSESDHYVSFVALLAAVATLTTLIYNLRRHMSEDYFKDAKEYLKRAYEVLEPKKDDAAPDDRELWLDAARLLKTADRLGHKILMDSHKESYSEEREFWKSKFRGIIKDFGVHYYCDGIDKFNSSPRNNKPISEPSIYVIHKFISGGDDNNAPLLEESFSDKEITSLNKKFPNLAYLLTESRKK